MGNIYVSVTVDWEGEHFKCINDLCLTRTALERAVGARIPFTHYICPNYWLTKEADTAKKNIGQVWNPDLDEIGLHVHCWKTLVEGAKRPFLYDKSLDWDKDGTGHGIPLGSYTFDAIMDILGYSRRLLCDGLSLPNVPGFRCGGWLTSDIVFKALMNAGFAYDCSAVPPVYFSQGFSSQSEGDHNATDGLQTGDISKFLVKIWGYSRQIGPPCLSNSLSLRWNANDAITPATQPYKVFENSKSIIEMPNNGGLADYVITDKMLEIFQLTTKLGKGSNEPVFLNVGCHLEGEPAYKKLLVAFFEKAAGALRSLMDKGELDFVTVADASKCADLYMVD